MGFDQPLDARCGVPWEVIFGWISRVSVFPSLHLREITMGCYSVTLFQDSGIIFWGATPSQYDCSVCSTVAIV